MLIYAKIVEQFSHNQLLFFNVIIYATLDFYI